MVNDAVGSGPGDAEQRGELTRRQVRAAVRRDQQCPVCWRQAPRPARRVASPPSRRSAITRHELARAQPGERDYPERL